MCYFFLYLSLFVKLLGFQCSEFFRLWMSKITKYCLILCNALGGDLNCISFFHFRSQNTGGDYKFIPYVSPTNNLEDTTVAIAFFLIFFSKENNGQAVYFCTKNYADTFKESSQNIFKAFFKNPLAAFLINHDALKKIMPP